MPLVRPLGSVQAMKAPCEVPTGDDVDLESRTNFLESLNTIAVLDSRNVDELKKVRKRKMKKLAEEIPHIVELV